MAGSPEKYNACIRELAAHLKEAKRKGGMDEEKRLNLPFVIENLPMPRTAIRGSMRPFSCPMKWTPPSACAKA